MQSGTNIWTIIWEIQDQEKLKVLNLSLIFSNSLLVQTVPLKKKYLYNLVLDTQRLFLGVQDSKNPSVFLHFGLCIELNTLKAKTAIRTFFEGKLEIHFPIFEEMDVT